MGFWNDDDANPEGVGGRRERITPNVPRGQTSHRSGGDDGGGGNGGGGTRSRGGCGKRAAAFVGVFGLSVATTAWGLVEAVRAVV